VTQGEITFGGRTFDPREAQPDFGRDDAPSPDRQRIRAWFVQLRASLQPQDAARLRERFGLRLLDYVPDHTYLERISLAGAVNLTFDPAIRAVALLPSELLLTPALRRARDDNDPSGQRVNLVLFPDVDPRPAVDAAARIGAGEIVMLDRRSVGAWTTLQLDVAPSLLDALAAIDGVRWIEHVPVIVDGADTDRAQTTDGDIATAAVAPPPTAAAGQQMFRRLWDAGLTGAGQTMGVLDNGPPELGHRFFRDPDNDTPGAGHRKVVALRNNVGQAPGAHATFVAACAAGDDFEQSGAHACRGGAFAARLAIGNRKDMAVFGNPQPATATTLLDELLAAAAAGARVHSNSWHARPPAGGVPGAYDLLAAEADAFAWQNEDHLVLAASGNTNEHQGSPGTAKNVLCVSAATDDGPGSRLGDGAHGPTPDGRRKPDLMSVGCGLTSALVGTDSDLVAGVCACSYATPLAAAAAVLARQAIMEDRVVVGGPLGAPPRSAGAPPTGALLRALLVHASIPTSGVDAYPSDFTGWGLLQLQDVLLADLLTSTVALWDVRRSQGLMAQQHTEYVTQVPTRASTLRATLVWTDPPGTPGASRSTVNDLDLVLTGPDGATYLGNAFPNGSSVPDGTAESRNNIEVVRIVDPTPGAWTISVSAREVNVGGDRQGYALVVSSQGAP
jgi:hypothetical protein